MNSINNNVEKIEYTSITSRKNDTVIEACELCKNKKARDAKGVFVIEGVKLFEEATLSGMEIQSVFVTEKAVNTYSDLLAKAQDAKFYLVTDEVYSKLSDESAPQGIFAVVKKPQAKCFTDDAINEGGFVILEDVQNPLNIGAILRCCYSLGFEKIVFSGGCADIYSPKCARAAMGSLFKIKTYFSDNLPETASKIVSAGNRIFCTALSERSTKLGEVDFLPSDSFVIGNEGHGATDELMKACTHSLFIPMNQGAESLNAATAAAIVMWEMRKGIL